MHTVTPRVQMSGAKSRAVSCVIIVVYFIELKTNISGSAYRGPECANVCRKRFIYSTINCVYKTSH
jgi:hypothetical protein